MYIQEMQKTAVVAFQSLSHVWNFPTPRTAAWQASLLFTISQNLINLCLIMMPCSHLILCRSLLLMPSVFPRTRVFPVSQFFALCGQSIGASASASVLPIQCWFPLGLTGFISWLSNGLSRVFSSTTIWKHQFFSAQPFLWSKSHICISLLEKS